MICPDCRRSLPDDSGCPWCTQADRAADPTIPASPRLAIEREGREEADGSPLPLPAGLVAARKALADAVERSKSNRRPPTTPEAK